MNQVQKLVVEVEAPDVLKQVLGLALPTCLESTARLAIKPVPRDQEHRALHLPSCLMGGIDLPTILISGWYDDRGRDWFNGYQPFQVFAGGDQVAHRSVIAHVIDALNVSREGWEVSLLPKMIAADEAADDFDGGAIKLGYRLQTCNTFPQILAIQPCLIFYGK